MKPLEPCQRCSNPNWNVFGCTPHLYMAIKMTGKCPEFRLSGYMEDKFPDLAQNYRNKYKLEIKNDT